MRHGFGNNNLEFSIFNLVTRTTRIMNDLLYRLWEFQLFSFTNFILYLKTEIFCCMYEVSIDKNRKHSNGSIVTKLTAKKIRLDQDVLSQMTITNKGDPFCANLRFMTNFYIAKLLKTIIIRCILLESGIRLLSKEKTLFMSSSI